MSIAKAEFIETPVKQTKGLNKTVSKKAYRYAVEDHSDLHTLAIIAYKRRVGILATAVIIMGVQLLVPTFWSLVGSGVESLFNL